MSDKRCYLDLTNGENGGRLYKITGYTISQDDDYLELRLIYNEQKHHALWLHLDKHTNLWSTDLVKINDNYPIIKMTPKFVLHFPFLDKSMNSLTASVFRKMGIEL